MIISNPKYSWQRIKLRGLLLLEKGKKEVSSTWTLFNCLAIALIIIFGLNRDVDEIDKRIGIVFPIIVSLVALVATLGPLILQQHGGRYPLAILKGAYKKPCFLYAFLFSTAIIFLFLLNNIYDLPDKLKAILILSTPLIFIDLVLAMSKIIKFQNPARLVDDYAKGILDRILTLDKKTRRFLSNKKESGLLKSGLLKLKFIQGPTHDSIILLDCANIAIRAGDYATYESVLLNTEEIIAAWIEFLRSTMQTWDDFQQALLRRLQELNSEAANSTDRSYAERLVSFYMNIELKCCELPEALGPFPLNIEIAAWVDMEIDLFKLTVNDSSSSAPSWSLEALARIGSKFVEFDRYSNLSSLIAKCDPNSIELTNLILAKATMLPTLQYLSGEYIKFLMQILNKIWLMRDYNKRPQITQYWFVPFKQTIAHIATISALKSPTIQIDIIAIQQSPWDYLLTNQKGVNGLSEMLYNDLGDLKSKKDQIGDIAGDWRSIIKAFRDAFVSSIKYDQLDFRNYFFIGENYSRFLIAALEGFNACFDKHYSQNGQILDQDWEEIVTLVIWVIESSQSILREIVTKKTNEYFWPNYSLFVALAEASVRKNDRIQAYLFPIIDSTIHLLTDLAKKGIYEEELLGWLQAYGVWHKKVSAKSKTVEAIKEVLKTDAERLERIRATINRKAKPINRDYPPVLHSICSPIAELGYPYQVECLFLSDSRRIEWIKSPPLLVEVDERRQQIYALCTPDDYISFAKSIVE